MRLITDVSKVTDGRIYNPSRLVYGTNAWFYVDCQGSFPLNNVVWHVVSGPAQIVITNRYSVCVEPTANNGEVVIEARFGNDTNLQPRFVLPIVKPRSFPVRVYYVKNMNNKKPDKLNSFSSDFAIANNIFAQIGVSFHQVGEPQEIGDSSYSVLPVYDIGMTENGQCSYTSDLSEKASSLLCMLTATNCVRIVYVSELTNSTFSAFTVPTSDFVVMSDEASRLVLAHEFGHILGLEDIYGRLLDNQEQLMIGYNDQAYAEIFEDKTHDWSGEDGRGFYEASDTHGVLIECLLMNGINHFEERILSVDIPSGRVRGYPAELWGVLDRRYMKVGADSTTKEEWK